MKLMSRFLWCNNVSSLLMSDKFDINDNQFIQGWMDKYLHIGCPASDLTSCGTWSCLCRSNLHQSCVCQSHNLCQQWGFYVPQNLSLIRLVVIFLAFSVNPRFCVKIPVDQQFLFKVTSQISPPILVPGLNFCTLSWMCLHPSQQHFLLYDSDWIHSTIASEWKLSCCTLPCTHHTLAML